MIYLVSILAAILAVLLRQATRQQKLLEEESSLVRRDLLVQRKESEKVCQQEMQNLLDALPYPFFSINEQGRVVRVNGHGTSILGGRAILNRSVRQVFIDQTIVECIQKSIARSEEHQSVVRLPFNSVFSADAEKESYWEIDLHPLQIEGNGLEFQLLMRNITSSVITDQVRKDFVANASHELRTPLSIISGYLEHLNEDDGLENPDLARKMLKTMDRHVVRINRIVDDLLTIAKLESKESERLSLGDFNLKACLNDLEERLEPLLSTKGTALIQKVTEPVLQADHFYLTQVLFNLIENALKQNSTTPIKVIVSGGLDSEGAYQIKVSDNGIGIPSDDLPFIFKRFYRVQKDHSQTQIKGTGLGLSIVKRAIEAHDGTISVTSTPGIDTTFTIKIPQPGVKTSKSSKESVKNLATT